MLEDVLYLVGGLVALVASGEYLVRGAVGIAQKLNVAPMVIGLTVVAFGTSAPELLVSLNAAYAGTPEIAIGNVVGSNIANISFILGITAIIFPLAVERGTLRTDWPVMMFGTILTFFFMWDLEIQRWEGLTLFALLIVFVSVLVRKALKNRGNNVPDEYEETKGNSMALYLLIVVGGLVGMYFGSEYMLEGAVGIADRAGMSKHVIGVTIVAVGTSVPELVTSIVASLKKQTDISVGNLLGSNIFNLGAVIGLTGTIKPIPVDQQVMAFDMWVVAGVSFVLLPLLLHKFKVHRWKGVMLLLAYLGYVGYTLIQVIGE